MNKKGLKVFLLGFIIFLIGLFGFIYINNGNWSFWLEQDILFYVLLVIALGAIFVFWLKPLADKIIGRLLK